MPSSNRRGFTLIELLIVVVIIGVLAAIAVPKFQNTKGKANAASLKADLRNLVTAEEAYFYDTSAGGWSAKVTHPLAWPIECAIFFGSGPALAPATNEGLLACS